MDRAVVGRAGGSYTENVRSCLCEAVVVRAGPRSSLTYTAPNFRLGSSSVGIHSEDPDLGLGHERSALEAHPCMAAR